MAQTDAGAQAGAQVPSTPDQPSPVDLVQLAERVYQLMLADLRLEHARGARPLRRKVR